jgi:hypothetical protein
VAPRRPGTLRGAIVVARRCGGVWSAGRRRAHWPVFAFVTTVLFAARGSGKSFYPQNVRAQMQIRDNQDFIEIDVVDRVPGNLPTPGDVELSVEVSSGKFRGQAFAWIEARKLSSFIAQLCDLERSRTGSAEMEGMSPGEFRLRIFSIDRRGHVAIEGRLVHQASQSFRHSIDFGFEFDPTFLPKVVAGFTAIVSE